MNKVILMGRLTRDPELRYSQGAEPIAVARYSLAINKKFKREGEPDADFFNCVVFGKSAEFAQNYFKKGQMVAITGRLSNSKWQDQAGQNRISTEIIVEEQHFAESKSSFESRMANRNNSAPFVPSEFPQPNQSSHYHQAPEASKETAEPFQYQQNQADNTDGFYPIRDSVEDEELPF